MYSQIEGMTGTILVDGAVSIPLIYHDHSATPSSNPNNNKIIMRALLEPQVAVYH